MGWHVRDLGYDSPVSVTGGAGGAVFTRAASTPFITGGMNRFVSGGGWLAREDLTPFIPTAATLGADTGFLIGREDRAIALRTFTSGKPAGESVLQAKSGAQVGGGHIAANVSGAARAAWVEYPEAPKGAQILYAARVFPGPLWGARRQIETSTCSLIDPTIAVSDVGEGLLVWAETCGRRHALKSVRTLDGR